MTQTGGDWYEAARVRCAGRAGQSRIAAIRQVQITEQTYYRWRKQYGGTGIDRLKDLKRLQKGNERFRRAASDLTLNKLVLSEAAKGNF